MGGGACRSKWVFCAQTFGPRSSHPTSFASPFDVCQMSSPLARVPGWMEEVSSSWAGPETSYLHLRSPSLSGHSCHCSQARGPGHGVWTGRASHPSPCLTWWKALDAVEDVHIVSANCTQAVLKGGTQASLGSCPRRGGSLDSTFSEPLFLTDHDPPSYVGSLGVLGKRHKGSHFVGLRRQP